MTEFVDRATTELLRRYEVEDKFSKAQINVNVIPAPKRHLTPTVN